MNGYNFKSESAESHCNLTLLWPFCLGFRIIREAIPPQMAAVLLFWQATDLLHLWSYRRPLTLTKFEIPSWATRLVIMVIVIGAEVAFALGVGLGCVRLGLIQTRQCQHRGCSCC